MRNDSTQKLILLQNLLTRATELAIAQKGKDVTVDDALRNLKELKLKLDPTLSKLMGE